MPAIRQYLTAEEVAEITGTHPRSVRRHCREGVYRGAYQPIPRGHWRIPASSVPGGLDYLRSLGEQDGEGPAEEDEDPLAVCTT